MKEKEDQKSKFINKCTCNFEACQCNSPSFNNDKNIFYYPILYF